MTGHNIINNFITARVCPVADPEGPLPGGGGRGLAKSARSAAEEGSGRGKNPPAGGGPGSSPGKILKNGCKRCIASPFLPSLCWFSPKNCVYFFHSKLRCKWCGRIFTLAVEDHIKPKEGFLSSRSKGGGFGVFLRKCKWCILSPFLPVVYWFFTPKLCVIFLPSKLRYTWCGIFFFPFALGEGGGMGSSPVFFWWKTDVNDAFWVHSKPIGCVMMREFSSHLQGIIWEELWGFFCSFFCSCVGRL